jgi:hypothetical protein
MQEKTRVTNMEPLRSGIITSVNYERHVWSDIVDGRRHLGVVQISDYEINNQ